VRSADFIETLFWSVLEHLQNIQPAFAKAKKARVSCAVSKSELTRWKAYTALLVYILLHFQAFLSDWAHRFTRHIYVREGRRIWGEYNFTERDAALDSATGLPKRKSDGIAVAEFGFDSHGVHKYDPAHPGVREGYIFIEHQPLQLPYRILVPKCVDGLLVPVACSASHVGYQTIRMEPVFMALSEACGIAAKTALDAMAEVRSVNVPMVQREILKRGGVLLYESAPLVPEGL